MKLKFAREGHGLILAIFLLFIFALFFSFALGIIFGLGFFFAAFFFRDPEREIPDVAGAILSPADGRIVGIKEVNENGQESVKISIFLSIFDVHVNRAPIYGELFVKEYRKGKFLDARNPASGQLNEAYLLGIKNGELNLFFKLIAGKIARRVVVKPEVGDKIEQGERIGIIKFGSRAEVYLPKGCLLKVKEGDKVRGGESIVAMLRKGKN